MKQFHQNSDVRNSMNTQINISITYFFCSQFISFCTRPQLWLSHNRSCPATSTANFLSQARHLKNFLQLFLQLLYWCSWSKAYYFSGRHPYANKQSPILQCACATALLKPFLLLWQNLKWQKISISKWNYFAIFATVLSLGPFKSQEKNVVKNVINNIWINIRISTSTMYLGDQSTFVLIR